MDFVNSKENGTYLWNLAHFVSVLADNVIFCCGDLLPLLSSVTSRDYGQDVIEPCGGMTLETSFSFLNRLMSLVDVIVFTSSLAFSGVEANRNMSTGGFLRQCLRLGEGVREMNVLVEITLWNPVNHTDRRSCLKNYRNHSNDRNGNQAKRK